jgi:hypothetical protein
MKVTFLFVDFGVLSGIPIPTLWPVLPESASTPRTRNTQPKLQPGDSRNKQLFGTTQFPPQNNGIPGSFASGYAASGGALLSQMVQPSQPIMPSSPFLNSPIPTLYNNPQLQQNNMVQLPQTYPINVMIFRKNYFLKINVIPLFIYFLIKIFFPIILQNIKKMIF